MHPMGKNLTSGLVAIVLLLAVGSLLLYIGKPKSAVEGEASALLICDNIADTIKKSNCIAIITGNPGKCQTSSREELSEADDCYALVAIRNKDPSICDKINDNDTRDECLPLAERIPTNCGNAVFKDRCYFNFAKLVNDASACVSMRSDQRDYCTAYVTEDSTYCDNLNSSYLKEQCYLGVAVLKRNTTLCDKVGEVRQYCTTIASRDTKFDCAGLSSIRCVYVAVFTRDASVCDKITVSAKMKDACYKAVASVVANIVPAKFLFPA